MIILSKNENSNNKRIKCSLNTACIIEKEPCYAIYSKNEKEDRYGRENKLKVLCVCGAGIQHIVKR